MPPSARITLRRGCSTKTGDMTRSDSVAIVSKLISEMINGVGASLWGMIGRDDEPMCRQSAVSVLFQRREHRVPFVRPEGRQAERGRVLRERDGAGTVRGGAFDLGGTQRGRPHRHDRQRDEPGRVGRAPFVEHEVVPRLHARQPELVVGALEEGLPGEPGELAGTPTTPRSRRCPCLRGGASGRSNRVASPRTSSSRA